MYCINGSSFFTIFVFVLNFYCFGMHRENPAKIVNFIHPNSFFIDQASKALFERDEETLKSILKCEALTPDDKKEIYYLSRLMCSQNSKLIDHAKSAVKIFDEEIDKDENARERAKCHVLTNYTRLAEGISTIKPLTLQEDTTIKPSKSISPRTKLIKERIQERSPTVIARISPRNESPRGCPPPLSTTPRKSILLLARANNSPTKQIDQ